MKILKVSNGVAVEHTLTTEEETAYLADLEASKQTDADNFNSLSYSKKRTTEYPSIGDQLDALFHAGVFPAEMAAQIQAVKDKYPKGGN